MLMINKNLLLLKLPYLYRKRLAHMNLIKIINFLAKYYSENFKKKFYLFNILNYYNPKF